MRGWWVSKEGCKEGCKDALTHEFIKEKNRPEPRKPETRVLKNRPEARALKITNTLNNMFDELKKK